MSDKSVTYTLKLLIKQFTLNDMSLGPYLSRVDETVNLFIKRNLSIIEDDSETVK